MQSSTVMKLVCSQFCSCPFIRIQHPATPYNFQLTMGMQLQANAVYENRVLRPLQRLDLTEHEHAAANVIETLPSGRSSVAVE